MQNLRDGGAPVSSGPPVGVFAAAVNHHHHIFESPIGGPTFRCYAPVGPRVTCLHNSFGISHVQPPARPLSIQGSALVISTLTAGRRATLEKPAPTDHPIHDFLRTRWSPRAFDTRPVEGDVLRSLFEAARWAPSSFNEQPWRFIVSRQNIPLEFDRMVACLVPGNQAWARYAPVLVIAVACTLFSRNGKPNRHAWYDVGQTVAHLSVEATARGLLLHQMAGIDVAKIRETYEIPIEFDPVTAVAIGYPTNDLSGLSEDLQKMERGPRSSRTQSDFVFASSWQKPFGSQ